MESRTGAVTLASRWRLARLSRRRLSPVWHSSVSCCTAFPRSEYYQRVRLPPSLLSPSGWSIRLTYSACFPGRDGGGSPRCHDASISAHAVLLDPAGVSSDHRLLRSLTVAFQVFDPVGLRMCHEAQSLHLRYGLDIALSTLNSCRHLHEPKTRFPVGWLVPFRGGSFTR